jgi:hypothetical protein
MPASLGTGEVERPPGADDDVLEPIRARWHMVWALVCVVGLLVETSLIVFLGLSAGAPDEPGPETQDGPALVQRT